MRSRCGEIRLSISDFTIVSFRRNPSNGRGASIQICYGGFTAPSYNAAAMWDVFVSHASEDKQAVAAPLARALEANGLKVWLDTQELNVGDSLRRKLDQGLLNAQFGIVILSPSFFRKKWPQLELDALVELEQAPDKIILPVWHELTANEIKQVSPLLASKIGVETRFGLDEVVIRLLRSIRTARKQTSGYWLRFNESGMPDEFAISQWLRAGESCLSKPHVAWPTEVLTLVADSKARHPSLAFARPVEGQLGWYNYQGRSIRDFERDFLSRLPADLQRWDELLPVRLVNLANGLKHYGKGYGFAGVPVRNFLFLWHCHLRRQLRKASAYYEGAHRDNTDLLDDLRALVHSGSRELASVHAVYWHSPNRLDTHDRALKGFRMWGPRRCVEVSRPPDQWYVHWELFEEYFVPQLELSMMLEFDDAAITYSSHRERWDLSSFKDEDGDHI